MIYSSGQLCVNNAERAECSLCDDESWCVVVEPDFGIATGLLEIHVCLTCWEEISRLMFSRAMGRFLKLVMEDIAKKVTWSVKRPQEDEWKAAIPKLFAAMQGFRSFPASIAVKGTLVALVRNISGYDDQKARRIVDESLDDTNEQMKVAKVEDAAAQTRREERFLRAAKKLHAGFAKDKLGAISIVGGLTGIGFILATCLVRRAFAEAEAENSHSATAPSSNGRSQEATATTPTNLITDNSGESGVCH